MTAGIDVTDLAAILWGYRVTKFIKMCLRRFCPKKLTAILEAGRLAPTAKNLQEQHIRKLRVFFSVWGKVQDDSCLLFIMILLDNFTRIGKIVQ